MKPEDRDWYGWLLAVRSTDAWDRALAWPDALREAGTRIFYELPPGFFDPDGQLYDGRTPRGRYRFIEVAEARSRFGAAPWLEVSPPCPWVGPVQGFITLDWWTDEEGRLFDAERLLAAGKGYLVRTTDNLCFDILASNTYRLADAHAKHGFGDGDDLPELGPAYEAYVWQTIQEALAHRNLQAERITYGTSHNRIRFDQLLPAKGETLHDIWGRFQQYADDELEIWAYNRNRDLLRRVLEDVDAG